MRTRGDKPLEVNEKSHDRGFAGFASDVSSYAAGLQEALDAKDLPKAIGECARLHAVLFAQLVVPLSVPLPTHDETVDITAAAKLLGMSTSWLYRNAVRLPFTRRIPPRTLRFSVDGIRRYLALRRA